MALKSEFMACGMPSAQATRLGYDPVANFTAAGTTQGTATVLTSNNANVTTSSIGGGVIIKSSEQFYNIYNAGPNVLDIYPVVGTSFAGLAANASIQVAPGGLAQIAAAGPSGAVWTIT